MGHCERRSFAVSAVAGIPLVACLGCGPGDADLMTRGVPGPAAVRGAHAATTASCEVLPDPVEVGEPFEVRAPGMRSTWTLHVEVRSAEGAATLVVPADEGGVLSLSYAIQAAGPGEIFVYRLVKDRLQLRARCSFEVVEPCTPTTCEAVGATCGKLGDGCGAELDCGGCAAPDTCGGGGVPNRCGCTPLTCEGLPTTCGVTPDACGGLLDCGACPVCGDGGCDGAEDCASCERDCGTCPEPTTCAATGKDCGLIDDGLGGTLSCGACTAPATCGGGGVANVCGCASGSCTGTLEAGPLTEVAPGLGTVTEVRAGGRLEVVWATDRYVLFWSRNNVTCVVADGHQTCTLLGSELVATELSPSGEALAPGRVIMDMSPGWAGHIRALAHRDGFTVAWIRTTSDDSGTRNEVGYALLSAEFDVTSTGSFEIQSPRSLLLAGDHQTQAIMWDTNTPHQHYSFARIDAEGTLSTPRAISAPFFSHMVNPELAWDGVQFGWVYESDRETLIRCGCNMVGSNDPVEVILTRIAADGTRLPSTVISEGIEEGQSFKTGLSIAGRLDGGFAIGWIGSAGGRDVRIAVVDAAGAKLGPNRQITADGEVNVEATTRLARLPGQGGFLLTWGTTPAQTLEPTSFGLSAQLLDANGRPAGAAVSALPGRPECSNGSSRPSAWYPSPSMSWCYRADLATHMSFAVGAGGTAMPVWPSVVQQTIWGTRYVLYTSPLTF